ncbi:MAG: nickel-dependent hydrogenase large subunit [Deltaproteobacteria bacterium]|nr:nickel-dependent hydrogenase large subunit [Deltaproteobacteria bacterium]
MARERSIQVNRLTRVEGHGNIRLKVAGGEVAEAAFDIVEPPRFFEAFLRGRPYEEVVRVVSRVCGICAVSHRCAGIKATEAAFGVEVTPLIEDLRKLAMAGEMMSSHLLHVLFLAAPDYLGVDSVLDLAGKRRALLALALRLKKAAYDVSETVCGRHTHPITMETGGFTQPLDQTRLHGLKKRMELREGDLAAFVDLVGGMAFPSMDREVATVCLTHPHEYAAYQGRMAKDGEEPVDPSDYADYIAETVKPPSTAKHSQWQGENYVVGALSRIRRNFGQLEPEAREAADQLGVRASASNPFMNVAAQAVEVVHFWRQSWNILQRLLNSDLPARDQSVEVSPRAGRGVGAVEAPRGLLIHEYEYDEDGVCRAVNLIIPTAQNLASMEEDLKLLARNLEASTDRELARKLSMMIRAYDPCISCSAH